MANSRCDLGVELRRRLTGSEFDASGGYLNDAIYYCSDEIADNRTRDALYCAISELRSKGEYHAAHVVSEYLRYF